MDTHLNQIKPIVDLPVGQQLQDKYGVLLGPFIIDTGNSFNRDRDVTIPNIKRWLFHGKGPFAGGRTEVAYSITTSVARRESRADAPDIHTYCVSFSADSRLKLDFSKSFNFNPKSLEYMESSKGHDSFYQLVSLGRSFGHGFVKLKDKNPYSPLIIDPKYLQDDRDVQAVVEGMISISIN